MFGLGAALGGALGGVGEFFSAQQAADAQRDVNAANVGFGREQMAFSAAQADKQMHFQQNMADSIYTRGAADLQRAGLNPMLAAGAPGGDPGGAMASSATSAPSNPVPPTIGAAVGGAVQALRLMQDLRESNSRIELNRENSATSVASGYEKTQRGNVLKQDEEMLAKQNQILQNELSFRQRHPGGTGMMDVIRNYVPFINSGATAMGMLAE